MADWQPGDFLPGLYAGSHAGPIFKLKDDHPDDCEQYGERAWDSDGGRFSDSMRWTPE